MILKDQLLNSKSSELTEQLFYNNKNKHSYITSYVQNTVLHALQTLND